MLSRIIMLMKAAAPTYRYLRLHITDTVNDEYCVVADCRFRVGATDYPTVNMTSDTAPSPLVSTYSSRADATESAWLAFDSNTASYWRSAIPDAGPYWISLDLGAGNGINPTALILTTNATGGDLNRSPRTFTVRGSNTGAFAGEETILHTETNYTWASAGPFTFTF